MGRRWVVVIFVSNPTFRLNCGWVGVLTINLYRTVKECNCADYLNEYLQCIHLSIKRFCKMSPIHYYNNKWANEFIVYGTQKPVHCTQSSVQCMLHRKFGKMLIFHSEPRTIILIYFKDSNGELAFLKFTFPLELINHNFHIRSQNVQEFWFWVPNENS